MIRSVMIGVLALLLLGGCAAVPQKPVEEIVRARATAHQQARLDNNYELAYTFTSPGYRETHPYKFYLGRMGASVRRRAFDIKSVSCEGELCRVVVNLSYSYLGKAGQNMGTDYVLQRELDEKWILVDSEWWLVPDR